MKITNSLLAVLGALVLGMGAGCLGDDDTGSIDPDSGPAPDPDPAIGELGTGVSTLTGSSQAAHFDGPRGVARFFNPVNVAVHSSGDVFVADFDNSMVRRVKPNGDTTTVFPADENFFRPFGMAFLDDNTLLVQTDYNAQAERGGALWRVDIGSGAKSLVRNNVGRPRGLAKISANEILFVEYQRHVVQVYNMTTNDVTTIAGNNGVAGFADGNGASAQFDIPYDAVVLPNGNFLVADQMNNRLREVTRSGQVSTFAGTGAPATVDGPRAQASFNQPQALAVDRDGNVFVTERNGYVLRKIDPSGNVSTIAGSGQPGHLDDHNDPNAARFWGLEGLDVSSDGQFLYVSDGNRGERHDAYNFIRRVQLR